jgi:cytochrome c oxidase assembly protein subunit 15
MAELYAEGATPTGVAKGVAWFARATVVATFVLIIAGGLVTSRDAGLAVPDWPLSFGTLNPPNWWQIDNVRTEHGHRLIAGSVALLTLALAWVVRRSTASLAVRRLTAFAAGLVLFQALLGGLRVLHLSVDLAMVHALTGQLFLCVVVGVATLSSPAWPQASTEASTSGDVRRGAWILALVLLQLVIGILVRHYGPAVRPLLGSHLFQVHVAIALVVTWLAGRNRAAARGAVRPGAARRASVLLNLLSLQLALGLATFAVTDTMGYDRQATAAESWIPTFHVAVGAGVLATAARSLLYAWAGNRPATSGLGAAKVTQ